MAMTPTTATAISAFHAMVGTSWFTQRDYVNGITWRTFMRWADVQSFVRTDRIYYTVQQLVDLLNECAGDDCYDCDWHYQVDESGRAYQDVTTILYHFRS